MSITTQDIPSTIDAFSIVLRGTRTTDVTSVTVDGSNATLEPGSWYYRYLLSPGLNRITIKALNGTTELAEQIVETTVPVYQQELKNIWNTLDEWGLLLDVKRLPGESNRSLFHRLLSASQYYSGNNNPGLLYAMSRNLGIRFLPSAVQIGRGVSSTNKYYGTDPYLEVEQSEIRCSVAEMIHTVHGVVDAAFRKIELPEEFPPYDPADIVVADYFGNVLDTKDWEFIDSYIFVSDRRYVGVPLKVTYRYTARIGRLGLTLTQLKTALEAVTDAAGNSYFTMTLNVDGSYAASKLQSSADWNFVRFDIDKQANVYTPLTLAWSPLSVFELIDERFREKWYSNNHAYDTELEGWAVRVDKLSRSGWDDVILDKDGWEEPEVPAVLPHIYDNKTAHWTVGNTSYNVRDYHFLGGKNKQHIKFTRIGYQNKDWQSGAVDGKALKLIQFKARLE